MRSVIGEVQENGQIFSITGIGLTADEGKAKVFKNQNGAKSVYNKLSLGLETSAQLKRVNDWQSPHLVQSENGVTTK